MIGLIKEFKIYLKRKILLMKIIIKIFIVFLFNKLKLVF